MRSEPEKPKMKRAWLYIEICDDDDGSDDGGGGWNGKKGN